MLQVCFFLSVQKLRQIEQLKQQQSEGKLLESDQVISPSFLLYDDMSTNYMTLQGCWKQFGNGTCTSMGMHGQKKPHP